jgi:Ser/Thr protein kinase RdoA (MazF antagonist)
MVFSYIVYGKDNAPKFTKHFLEAFFKGYEEYNQLDSKWLKKIPYF